VAKSPVLSLRVEAPADVRSDDHGQTVAAKGPPSCFMVIQVKGGQYTRSEPANGYTCNGAYVPA